MRMKVIKPRKERTHRRRRVCAYVRVSSGSEELENSMENQKRFFEDYIRSNPEWELVDVYCDQGISGFCSNREQFQRMLLDAREGKIEILSCKLIQCFTDHNRETPCNQALWKAA